MYVYPRAKREVRTISVVQVILSERMDMMNMRHNVVEINRS